MRSKMAGLLLLLGLLLSLAACGGSVAPAEPVVAVRSVEDVQRISAADTRELLDMGEAVLIDARSTAAFEAGHAAGAISLPETEVAARFGELPTDKALVFY
jgi:hypothetical protein